MEYIWVLGYTVWKLSEPISQKRVRSNHSIAGYRYMVKNTNAGGDPALVLLMREFSLILVELGTRSLDSRQVQLLSTQWCQLVC